MATDQLPTTATAQEVRDDLLALLDHIGKVHSRLLDIKLQANWPVTDPKLQQWRQVFTAVNDAHSSVSLKLNTVLAAEVQASVDGLEKSAAAIRKKVEGLKAVASVLDRLSGALNLFTSIAKLFV